MATKAKRYTEPRGTKQEREVRAQLKKTWDAVEAHKVERAIIARLAEFFPVPGYGGEDADERAYGAEEVGGMLGGLAPEEVETLIAVGVLKTEGAYGEGTIAAGEIARFLECYGREWVLGRLAKTIDRMRDIDARCTERAKRNAATKLKAVA